MLCKIKLIAVNDVLLYTFYFFNVIGFLPSRYNLRHTTGDIILSQECRKLITDRFRNGVALFEVINVICKSFRAASAQEFGEAHRIERQEINFTDREG